MADGFNPLMFAALFGKVECVAAVLRHCRRHKKIINETNPEGDTALSLAALHGQRKVVQLLLRDGADVDAANRKGETALHAAAKNGHAQVVCALLTGGADVDKVDQLGYTALHHCCITNGGEDVADALLEVRATVDVKAKDDNTALHFACSAGNHMMVEALLRRKVNLTVRNNINQVAFDVAVKAGHDNVQQKLQPVRFHLQTQLQEINLAEQYTEARKFVKDCTPGPRQTHTKNSRTNTQPAPHASGPRVGTDGVQRLKREMGALRPRRWPILTGTARAHDGADCTAPWPQSRGARSTRRPAFSRPRRAHSTSLRGSEPGCCQSTRTTTPRSNAPTRTTRIASGSRAIGR